MGDRGCGQGRWFLSRPTSGLIRSHHVAVQAQADNEKRLGALSRPAAHQVHVLVQNDSQSATGSQFAPRSDVFSHCAGDPVFPVTRPFAPVTVNVPAFSQAAMPLP